MKILLICANGLSTSILMSKMDKWGKTNNVDLEVKAVPMTSYSNIYTEYDCILIGPQVSYRLQEIRNTAIGKPVETINPTDYGLGNVENIMKQVNACIANYKGE